MLEEVGSAVSQRRGSAPRGGGGGADGRVEFRRGERERERGLGGKRGEEAGGFIKTRSVLAALRRCAWDSATFGIAAGVDKAPDAGGEGAGVCQGAVQAVLPDVGRDVRFRGLRL